MLSHSNHIGKLKAAWKLMRRAQNFQAFVDSQTLSKNSAARASIYNQCEGQEFFVVDMWTVGSEREGIQTSANNLLWTDNSIFLRRCSSRESWIEDCSSHSNLIW